MIINPEDLKHRDTYRLLTSIIVPRPIALVSTLGEDGVFNLAPFSAFTSVNITPPMICFNVAYRGNGEKKDTLKNIEFSKDFVVNVVNEPLARAMNQASADYPSHIDEFKEVGLTPIRSEIVKAPRVAESPVNMECKLSNILQFGSIPTGSNLVIGEVVLIHVRDEFYINGEIEPLKLKAIGRLGRDFYCRTTDIFEMIRPESGRVI